MIQARFLDKLVATPRGRAFMLNFLRSTEESDEGGVFDALVTRVEDQELQKLVRVHRADEDRHAEIFRKAVLRVGGACVPVEAELRVVERVDGLLGGWAESFLARTLGVMEMYVLLLVVEERAVREWPAIAAALRKVDPESAADLERVIADERRHVKYARAISRRYAPDEATLERTIRRVRAAEKRAFALHTKAFTRIVLDRDLLAVGRLERIFWKGMALAA
jgi:rubrerythrin